MDQQVTVLMMSANPRGTTPLRLDEERREVEAGLMERSRLRDQFRLITKVAARPRDVQRAMLDHEPQVVHFSGHGEGEQGLLLEDEIGQIKLVSADALAALFKLYGDRLQCVVLNACYSTVQAEAIAQHIPYVIGMSDAISDRAAIEFAVAFYDALGAGRDVEFAYQNACVAIQLAGIEQAHVPVLHPQGQRREGRGQRAEGRGPFNDVSIVRLDRTTQEPHKAEDTADCPPTHPPIHPSTPQFSSYNPTTFAGRKTETATLMERLQQGCRIVAIVGMTGIGKTTLAERVVASLMNTTETPLPYLRFSLDDRSLAPDFSISGAALLRTLGDEPTLADQQDPTNLLHHILERLRSHPCRLQIDSLERLLRGNEQEGWSEFCDPLWLDLLQQLLAANDSPSQLLLTSQDIPGDLDAIASRTPQFWHCEPLQGLNPDEQRTLFQNLGLNPSATEWEHLQRIGAFYAGHPLVLQVIAEELRQPPFRGNIAHYWQHYEAEFTATAPATANKLDRSRLFRRRVRQRVEQAIQRLPEPARQLLCACAVFRRPVPEDFWYTMLPNGDPQSAFDTLQDHHLIEYTSDPLPFTLHPSPFLIRQHNLIRSIAYTLLKSEPAAWEAAERQAAHLWLTEYQPAPDAPNLETVRGYLEAFDHFCEVGDWEKACTVLNIQIDSPTQEPLHWQLETWGYYQEEIRLYEKVIGKTSLERDVLWLRGFGIAHSGLGNFSSSSRYHEQSLKLAQTMGDKLSEAKALGNLGVAYKNLGQYERAIHLQQQNLSIIREIGDRQDEGTALGNLGIAYDRLGQYERAIDFHQQHLTIAREISDRRGEGIALDGLGVAYIGLGQYEQAINFHQQRLRIAREIGDRRGESSALGNLGNVYDRLGKYERAIDFHQQHLAIAREIGDRSGEGNALGNLGIAYKNLGQYEQAIDFHQQSLAIKREIGDRQGGGNALGSLGIACYRLGQYERAISFYQQHLTIAREVGDRQGEGNALGNLGLAYRNLGQYERAIDFHQQRLTIAREIGDRRGEGTALGSLGIAYNSLGQYERAIDFYQQSLTIAREIGDRQGEGNALGNLGLAYHSLGQYERAIDFHQQNLTIAREIGDRQGEGNALGSLGLAYFSLGQYERAIDFHQQYLTIAREIGDRGGEAIALGNLGGTYCALGDYSRALELQEENLAIAIEIGSRQTESYALSGRGEALLKLEQYDEALTSFQNALAISQEIGERSLEAEILKNLAEVHQALGKVKVARQYAQQALALATELGIPLKAECESLLAELGKSHDS